MENKKGKKQHLVQCIGAKFANWHRGGLLLLLMHPPSSTFSSTPCFPLLTERWLLVHCNIGKSGNQSSTSLERTRSIYIDIVVLSLASLAKICQRPAKKKTKPSHGFLFFFAPVRWWETNKTRRGWTVSILDCIWVHCSPTTCRTRLITQQLPVIVVVCVCVPIRETSGEKSNRQVSRYAILGCCSATDVCEP